jgi:ABC-2 type transport system ATP-binding protein
MAEVVVEIRDLRKSYRTGWRRAPIEAVRGVSLTIERGEVFGFVGPNGAGKSTTIKTLVGAVAPTSGSVRINGREVTDPESRRGLGYVPENPSLSEYLTPLEVLRMGVRIHGLSLENETAHCLEWLARFGLEGVARRRIRTFSKGMMQRTALAHALAIAPSLLILDEPLSGLDPIGRREVVDVLAQYRHDGGTLFFSSHVLHDVESIADRFGLIHRGELVTVRSPQELAVEQADLFVVRYHGTTAVPGARSLQPGRFAVEVRAPDLPAVLTSIARDGGRLADVTHKVSLESVFHQLVTATH